ncbi:unnamed protein product [Brachionus calyciflorus]|uniref:Uncharacterized protein n=1 Tax=Brachionus calyciflorus TaxID=104777 RepID=A0A814S7F5_9BILA|nr:unnamed protein product [Brachionus calyciflorus]
MSGIKKNRFLNFFRRLLCLPTTDVLHSKPDPNVYFKNSLEPIYSDDEDQMRKSQDFSTYLDNILENQQKFIDAIKPRASIAEQEDFSIEKNQASNEPDFQTKINNINQ